MKPKNNHHNSSAMNGCRSLVCDSNGIIVAENVFRCMLCSSIFDSIVESKRHYYQFHVDDDDDEDLREVKQQVTQSRSTLSQAHPTVVRALTYAGSEARPSSQMNSPIPPMEKVIDEAEGNTEVAVGKAGHVKCAVCGVIRFYSCVYRRYGHFTCQVCYRFFRTFFTKPKRYYCQNLGLCKLNVRVRCRACWLLSCINLYAVDESRKATIQEFYPKEMEEVLSPEVPPTNFSVCLPREFSPLSQSPPPITSSLPPITSSLPPITSNSPPITSSSPPITSNSPPITSSCLPLALVTQSGHRHSIDESEGGPLVIDDEPGSKKLKTTNGAKTAANEIKTSFTANDFNYCPNL